MQKRSSEHSQDSAYVAAPRADCNNGDALVYACEYGHEQVARMLLTWPDHAPRADCNGGMTLIRACKYRYKHLAMMLHTWPEHAPSTDCLNSKLLAYFNNT